MHKCNIAGLLLVTLLGTSFAIADSISFRGENGTFQCSTSPAADDKNDQDGQRANFSTTTVKIDTHQQLIRGLRNQGNNSVNGITLGTIEGTSGGHLSKLPVWWKEADGTIIRLNDVCFGTKGERKNTWGHTSWGDGSVDVNSETGAISVSCHFGCTGTTRDFGVGDFG